MSKPSTSTGLGEPRAPSRKNADNISGDMSGKTEVNRESSGETPSAEVKQGQGSDYVKVGRIFRMRRGLKADLGTLDTSLTQKQSVIKPVMKVGSSELCKHPG